MTKLSRVSSFALLSILVVACAAEPDEEEQGQSESALKCPSPIEDREGFMRCMQKKASKNGTASSSKNGGTVQIGDIDSGGGSGCSNVTIRCDGNAPCSCECTGKGCREACCP